MGNKSTLENEKKINNYENVKRQSNIEESKGNMFEGMNKINTNSNVNNNNNKSNSSNYSTANPHNPKYSIQNLLRDDSDKKPNNSNLNQKEKPDGTISLKFDATTNEIKDVNVNMSVDQAYQFYQNNKQYLPTGQQVLSGVKSTANFVEKTGVLNESQEGGNIVTGNKPQKKSFDPLTNLFGLGGKKENTSSGNNNTSSSNYTKKHQF